MVNISFEYFEDSTDFFNKIHLGLLCVHTLPLILLTYLISSQSKEIQTYRWYIIGEAVLNYVYVAGLSLFNTIILFDPRVLVIKSPILYIFFPTLLIKNDHDDFATVV